MENPPTFYNKKHYQSYHKRLYSGVPGDITHNSNVQAFIVSFGSAGAKVIKIVEPTKFCTMKVVEIFKILTNPLKVMSDFDLRHEDGKHVEMYERFLSMRESCEKYAYIIASLAVQYGMSESTVKRIIRRLSQEVIF